MRARSGHIIFSKGVQYKRLAPIYEDLYMKFLKETDQVPDEDEVVSMMVRSNMVDLENNRKPEGFNRPGEVRMIFPMDDKNVSFYIYTPQKCTKVVKVTEKLSRFLQSNGLRHKVEWDKMVIDEYKRKK